MYIYTIVSNQYCPQCHNATFKDVSFLSVQEIPCYVYGVFFWKQVLEIALSVLEMVGSLMD